MTEAPLIVGVSGLRGIVGKSLTPEVAVRFAAAFGTWLSESASESPMVVIANDGRKGGEAITFAAASALMSTGCRVCDLGVATTPSVGVHADMIGAAGAVMVTASHNPQEWNGLKLMLGDFGAHSDGRGTIEESESIACAPPASLAAEIIARFESDDPTWEEPQWVASYTNSNDAEDAHCLRVLNAMSELVSDEDGNFWRWLDEQGKSYRVVVDAVNASASELDRVMFYDTPVQCILLYGDRSGVFPHTPEPTAENLSGEGGLCPAVPGLNADIGFAQDPDADRLAIVDENGRYIGEEYTLALCAEAILSARAEAQAPSTGDGPPVMVANLSTSRMIEDVAAKYDAEVVRTPVGEANVVERMKQLKEQGRDVVLGGEGNGGVIWPEVVYIRDSLSAMALTLSLMARTGKTISQLVDQINSYSPGAAGYAILKRKTDIPTKEAAKPAVEAVAKHFAAEKIDLQDGVRVDFDPSGPRAGTWVHVRASNTEPIMRLICEAPTEAIATEVLAETEKAIAN
ncbi:MAG: phosphoglucosamine mutase [Phycisphaerae bacterium]|nr:phosphoglucosamine mutase [Phycisphaerae bacterium]